MFFDFIMGIVACIVLAWAVVIYVHLEVRYHMRWRFSQYLQEKGNAIKLWPLFGRYLICLGEDLQEKDIYFNRPYALPDQSTRNTFYQRVVHGAGMYSK